MTTLKEGDLTVQQILDRTRAFALEHHLDPKRVRVTLDVTFGEKGPEIWFDAKILGLKYATMAYSLTEALDRLGRILRKRVPSLLE